MSAVRSLGVVNDDAPDEWTRENLVSYADTLLDAVKPWESENGSRVNFPGAPGAYGAAVDGLEGFARTFLLAGFRIVGARGQGVDELIDRYVRGIRAGVDPRGADRWVRIEEHPQSKVEAASIALILDMTRPWVWERLDHVTQQRVIEYLAPVVGDSSYPPNNWLWFRIIVQTFLRSVGGPWSPQDIADDLARHDSFVREGGWISDGEERSYDHYVGWALHLYPTLWAQMRGAEELSSGRIEADRARLAEYLQDAVGLVGADGAPLIQGRSLIYRFAAAAPFWAGVIAGVGSVPLGQLRQAGIDIVRHFARSGVPNEKGILDQGWHDEWPSLSQSYSGTASAYWGAKGLLGIALPDDHPVWSAPAVKLPSQGAGMLRIAHAPGWIISTTPEDGIVRVYNHGTDHAKVGDLVGDSPLYARLGYSGATSPLLSDDAWIEPLEQSVTIVDEQGRTSHRAGMKTLSMGVYDGVGTGGSTSIAHWLKPADAQVRHGAGLVGEPEVAGEVTTWSVVHGAWEVRIVRVESVGESSVPVSLRVGGWAVAADGPVERAWRDRASANTGTLFSMIVGLTSPGTPHVERRFDASPLGITASVPVMTYRVEVGTWVASAVYLSDRKPSEVPSVRITADEAFVTWTDKKITHHHLA